MSCFDISNFVFSALKELITRGCSSLLRRDQHFSQSIWPLFFFERASNFSDITMFKDEQNLRNLVAMYVLAKAF